MASYIAPRITPLGSVHEQTLTHKIHKTKGSGDVIYLDGDEVVSVPTGGS